MIDDSNNQFALGFDIPLGNDGTSLPTGIATNPLLVRSINNGASYNSSIQFPTFEINATEVQAIPFEFNPALGIGVLGAAWVVKKKLIKKAK